MKYEKRLARRSTVNGQLKNAKRPPRSQKAYEKGVCFYFFELTYKVELLINVEY